MTKEDIRRVAAARARVERDQQQLRQAIVDAFEGRTGHTVEDIAAAAGLTRERVYQIVKEEKA